MGDDPGTEGNSEQARRRRRRPSQSGSSGATPTATSEPSVEATRSRPPAAKRRERGGADGADFGERGLRDLVGAGRSQVGVEGALRARDLNRPTEADLAEAEATVSIVRRNWRPTT